MMTTLQGYARLGKRQIVKWLMNPRVQLAARGAGYALSGFGLSAASLGNVPLPIAMGLCFGASGGSAILAGLGSCLGYWLFWGTAGLQGILWVLVTLAVVLLARNNRLWEQTTLLMPAVAGLIVSASGVCFQIWMADTTRLELYLMRVCLGSGCAWLFYRVLRGRNPILEWLVGALVVLALAQIMPIQGLDLGIIAAAGLQVSGAFPAAALAGVALDLADITPVSMTAVMCAGYLVRFLPNQKRWLICFAPVGAYLLVINFSGQYDLTHLPGLVVGGIGGVLLPLPAKVPSRRGETGVAQVRLEMAAGALLQSEQLLIQTKQPPVDEDALICRAAERACGGCPCRSGCKDSLRLAKLPAALLHKPLLAASELPIICRKSGRFLAELHREQEHFRAIGADRARQEEYRQAVVQQYRFLAQYLQELSDHLASPVRNLSACYHANVEVFGNRPEGDNGDRCAVFAGVACRHYVVLCDGMGTGTGAVQEARTALRLLRRLLTAGYPAESAIQSLNSLCALRSRAGAVTVDMLELELDTGRARLFKWGAAPSYLMSKLGTEKIGTAGPPPGLSLTQTNEAVYRLSLRRGERLVLVSDGVGEEEALHLCQTNMDTPDRDLAAGLLERGRLSGQDDATVVVCTMHNA